MNNELYIPPSQISEDGKGELVKSVFAMISIILYAWALIGIIITIIQMILIFSQISATNQADPSFVAEEISVAILATLYGSVLSLIGLMFIFILHYKIKFRRVWFYNSVRTLAVIGCVVSFPMGMIFGLWIFLAMSKVEGEYLAIKRKISYA